jgi:hypothetical protein
MVEDSADEVSSGAFQDAPDTGETICETRSEVKILGPDYHAWIGANGKQSLEPPIPLNADDSQKWEIEQQRRVRANAIKTLLRRQQEELDALTANTNQLALDKAKKAKEEEQKELGLLQKAADLYDASNQAPSYIAYLPLSRSNSLAIKAQAYVAIAEMGHSDQKKAEIMREEGLGFLKTYQDENPGSGVAVQVEAAIQELIEVGRLRREAAKEDWEIL